MVVRISDKKQNYNNVTKLIVKYFLFLRKLVIKFYIELEKSK